MLIAVKSAVMLKSLRFAKEPERSVSERAVGWPLAIVTQSPLVTLVPEQPVLNVIGERALCPLML